MTTVFDGALDKRFADSPEVAVGDLGSGKILLLYDSTSGNLYRLSYPTLTSSLSGSYASLVGGKVPASQLPAYVDDVLEYASLSNFPATGESGKIYVALDTNRTYRWSGSAYIEISASPGTTDSVPEGSTNKYFTNARALSAAPAETTTTVGSLINSATAKASPEDADTLGLSDSAAGNILKKLSWSSLKSLLKTYFDTLYPSNSGNPAEWIPKVYLGNTEVAGYFYQVGTYVKLGKVVFIQGFVAVSDKGTGTGNLTIRNLPYTNGAGVSNNHCGVALDMDALVGITTQQIMGVIYGGNSYISLNKLTNGSESSLTDANVGTWTGFKFQASYLIS